MYRKIIILLLFLIFPIVLNAQAPPRAETQAAVLQDLSQRVGQTVSLGSFSSQQWFFGAYDFVRDLGCVGAPVAAPVAGGWQRFEYVYQNTTYVYLISDDTSSIVLCNEAALPTAIPPATAFAPSTQTSIPTVEPITATQTPAPVILVTPSSTAQPNIVTPESCVLPPRLEIGTIAAVTPGEPNWIHRQPARSTEKIGEIPGGEQVTVLDGPRCDLSTRMNYWQVDYNGLIGWTSEGSDGDYWLQPILPIEDDLLVDFVRQAQEPTWLDAVSSDTLVELSPGGLFLALGDTLGSVSLWLAPESELILAVDRQSPITAIEFHNSDSIIAIGSADGRVFVARNLLGDDLPSLTFGHDSAVSTIAISNDRSLLVVGDAAGKLTFWNLMAENTTTPALSLQLSEPAGSIEINLTTVLVRTINGGILTALRIPVPRGG